MAYIGHEPERETLKYRCPAKHEGWECPMSAMCNAGKSYGKTVRVPREVDLRRFPALPRATKKFERMYKGRTAVERVNARLKVFWGVDDGNLTGSRRFVAQVGVVLAVHAAFATLLASAPRREGTLGKTAAEPDRRPESSTHPTAPTVLRAGTLARGTARIEACRISSRQGGFQASSRVLLPSRRHPVQPSEPNAMGRESISNFVEVAISNGSGREDAHFPPPIVHRLLLKPETPPS